MTEENTIEVPNMPEPPKRKKRGFAAMSPELQKRIASAGGMAAHAKGKAHKFTPEEARAAGSKGGKRLHEKLKAAKGKEVGDVG